MQPFSPSSAGRRPWRLGGTTGRTVSPSLRRTYRSSITEVTESGHPAEGTHLGTHRQPPTRVSLAALIAVRPGCGPRLIYRTHRARRGDKRKGFTETDYVRFLAAACRQPDGPVVLVWDGLNTHTSRAMRELIAPARG
jgi:hypothetical protein